MSPIYWESPDKNECPDWVIALAGIVAAGVIGVAIGALLVLEGVV